MNRLLATHVASRLQACHVQLIDVAVLCIAFMFWSKLSFNLYRTRQGAKAFAFGTRPPGRRLLRVP
jgi:hypothetical protein